MRETPQAVLRFLGLVAVWLAWILLTALMILNLLPRLSLAYRLEWRLVLLAGYLLLAASTALASRLLPSRPHSWLAGLIALALAAVLVAAELRPVMSTWITGSVRTQVILTIPVAATGILLGQFLKQRAQPRGEDRGMPSRRMQRTRRIAR